MYHRIDTIKKNVFKLRNKKFASCPTRKLKYYKTVEF